MVWEGPKDSKLILSGVGWASPQYPQALRDVSNQQVGPKGQDVFSTVFFVCLGGPRCLKIIFSTVIAGRKISLD